MAKTLFSLALLALILGAAGDTAVGGDEPPMQPLQVHVSWGHRSPAGSEFYVRFLGDGVTIAEAKGEGLELGEGLRDGAWQTRSGGGDVDGVELALRYDDVPVKPLAKLHPIWQGLFAMSDPDTVGRLRLDPAYRPDPRRLTIQMNREGTRGFGLTVDQLLQSRTFWIPSLDVYVAVGDRPVPWAEHQEQLEPFQGKRILDQVGREPDATYADYTARWEDMGSPAYVHRSQPAPGHVICLTWDSAIPKFGIDRGAGVWNDYGNPDRFRLGFDFGDFSLAAKGTWKGQSLADGLPVVTTRYEKEGVRYEVEQFAYPLNGPPAERRGDIAMLLLESVRIANLTQQPRTVTLQMTHRRELGVRGKPALTIQKQPGSVWIEENVAHRVLLAVQGADVAGCTFQQPNDKDGVLSVPLAIPAGAARQLVVKLPSPVVGLQDREKLLALDYVAAREATLKFWSDYVARGAVFSVPEKVVNDLFRANLWHALRLPRRHGGAGPNVAIDLPYSNFAYSQTGTPWPVNQAVYVDYMLYDLRGYHDIAAEELLTMYRNNQQPNGHVGGFANWGVYTPGRLYAVGKHYLLSHSQADLERLLPPTLKAADWCLAEVRRAAGNPGLARGLIRAPANDGTGEGVWAFNQSYFFAGLDTLGQALRQAGHPRAQECLDAAREFRQTLERAYAAATVQAPLVQVRDHTWIPFVPNEILTPRRLMDQWYPTDVDGGATHLLRLKALPARNDLADNLLADQEDNLFLKGWGMANEPVYNQQATAYLLRDEPRAAIRAFYSGLACAFSHSALEGVEHRWTWGQYFCPPSTDGSWFDLYRHMLIDELDDGRLLLLQAAPSRWLADGKRIEVRGAPTYFGPMSLNVESRVASGEIRAELDMPDKRAPAAVLLRLRHPEGKPIRSVVVNGRDWPQFDASKQWVVIAAPAERQYRVVVRY